MNLSFPLNLHCLKIENAFGSRKQKAMNEEEEEENANACHALCGQPNRMEGTIAKTTVFILPR